MRDEQRFWWEDALTMPVHEWFQGRHGAMLSTFPRQIGKTIGEMAATLSPLLSTNCPAGVSVFGTVFCVLVSVVPAWAFSTSVRSRLSALVHTHTRAVSGRARG